MPAEIESADQAIAPVLDHIVGLSAGARILDFGCGVGRHTRELRRLGVAADGVDRPYPGLREELDGLPDGGANVHLSDFDGTFPFADSTYDGCFSTSVLEHVMDYDSALAEIARVLKPGAWSLHILPSRWRPIEPHTYVPLGGRFQSRAWFRLWAQLGVRNEFQQDMTPSETGAANRRYAQTGINYLPKSEIGAAFSRHFAEVTFVERAFITATRDVSRVSRYAARLAAMPGFVPLYAGIHTRAVLARTADHTDRT